MRAAALASALLCAIAARAFAPSRGAPRCFAQRAVVDDDAAEAATEVAVVASPLLRPPRCPLNLEGQMIAMRDAVVRADEAGVTRQRVRTLLPRGESRELVPPDETWTGGIMQLYAVCAPLTRDLLRAVGVARTGAAPKVAEQRLDNSGVDGESLMVGEATSAAMDVSAFVQPSLETAAPIREVCAAAGARLVLLVNPQWRDSDDTLDFIAKKTGFLGQLGGFLGGKAGLMSELDALGFVDTFSLQEYVVTGTIVRYFLSYPHKWQIFALSDRDDEAAIRIGESTSRPDYNKIAEVLEANRVKPKLFRDAGQAKPLVQGSITIFYEDD